MFVHGVVQGPSAEQWPSPFSMHENISNKYEAVERKLGGSVRYIVLANVDVVVVLGTNERTIPTSLVAQWLNSEVSSFTG